MPRPQGSRADIGAFEFPEGPPQFTAIMWQPSGLDVRWVGLPSQHYGIQTSADLADWVDFTNLSVDANGFGEFRCPMTSTNALDFFRLKTISP